MFLEGKSMPETRRVTIGGLLSQVAEEAPDAEALIDFPSGRRMTYTELEQAAGSVARSLMALGVEPGAHVALWGPNVPQWLIAGLGIVKAGCVLTSVDMRYRAEELKYLLTQAECRTLLMAPGVQGHEFLDVLAELCPELDSGAPGRLDCAEVPELANVIVFGDQVPSGAWDWPEFLGQAKSVSLEDLAAREAAVRPEDVATLLYTSGTTGAPKGVMSTHLGLVNVCLRSAANMRLTPVDRLCVSVPLCHMFGSICVALTGLTAGAALVLPSPDFQPPEVTATIEAERCTALFGAPNFFLALMEQPGFAGRDIASLRTGIMGGAQCPIELMKRVVDQMGMSDILVGFGQTEASSWLTLTSPDDPLELRVSTVGRAVPDVEVKIIDPGSGREVPRGKVGELCGRGFNMAGYFNLPAATARALDPEGWLHTGDMATMDEDRYVRIAGRVKETISKGGETIFPTEVEEILFTHPGVANAAVFGVPDPKLGEEVAVWIKPAPGSELTPQEIIAYCQGHLPPAHCPRYVKFVDAYPLTAVGKVQKFKMREQYAQELGLK